MPGQLAGSSVDRLKTVAVLSLAALAAAAITVSYLYKPKPKPIDNKKDSKKCSGNKTEQPKVEKTEAPAEAKVEAVKKTLAPVTAPEAEQAALPAPPIKEDPVAAVVMNPAKQQVGSSSAAVESGMDKLNNSTSWNQLVEDEEEQQESLSSTLAKMEISSPKPVKETNSGSIGPARSGSNRHDSGVVSPNGSSDEAAAMVVPVQAAGKTSQQQQQPAAATVDDGGLGTSVCEDESNDKSSSPQSQPQQQQQNSKHLNGSDSGQGSEADDGIRLAYHFYIPHYLCGKFIGVRGNNINSLKQTTKCSVQLRQLDENGCFLSMQEQRNSKSAPEGAVQVCLVEGTRTNIDHCLELIRQRFPVDQYPEVTLEQINLPSSGDGGGGAIDFSGGASTYGGASASSSSNASTAQPMQLGLNQGTLHDVFVSHIVSGGHVFLQQPNHPTHHSLERLEDLMSKAYTKFTSIPDIPREVIEPGLVCVARCYNSKWYRVQVVRYDAVNDTADVKFVDHGGYYNFPVSDLKQIRSDYLALPFQALECYLGNVIPLDGREWSIESGEVLRQMVQGVIISGRMLGVNEEGVPIVHLYGWVSVDDSVSQHEQQPRLLNRELVDRSVALWTEHFIAANGGASAPATAAAAAVANWC